MPFLKSKIFSCTISILQMNLSNSRFVPHLSCFHVKNTKVIYPHERRCLFLDPLGESKRNIQRCLESTRAFMRKKDCNVTRWTCSTLAHARQQDGTSCGVLALKFAEKILKGQPINIETHLSAVNNLRLDIATILLQETDDLSKVCHSCGMEESDNPQWICCDICDRWFHHECVLRPDVDGDYLCPACS
nr:uncharacterized protein LOC133611331 isoform X1 [Nerophis lumbriciformis]